MNALLLLVVFILFALIESSIVVIPLTLIFIIGWSIYEKKHARYWLALFSGILIDIFVVRSLGTTSLYFLVTAFIVSRYQKKVATGSWRYMLIFSLIAAGLYQVLFSQSLSVLHLVVVGILSVPVGLFAAYFSDTFSSRKSALTV